MYTPGMVKCNHKCEMSRFANSLHSESSRVLNTKCDNGVREALGLSSLPLGSGSQEEFDQILNFTGRNIHFILSSTHVNTYGYLELS